jgi:hypothetical protein
MEPDENAINANYLENLYRYPPKKCWPEAGQEILEQIFDHDIKGYN